jgi:hypothetical protein
LRHVPAKHGKPKARVSRGKRSGTPEPEACVNRALLAILMFLPNQDARGLAQDMLNDPSTRSRLRFQKLKRMIARVPEEKRLSCDVSLRTWKAEAVIAREAKR